MTDQQVLIELKEYCQNIIHVHQIRGLNRKHSYNRHAEPKFYIAVNMLKKRKCLNVKPVGVIRCYRNINSANTHQLAHLLLWNHNNMSHVHSEFPHVMEGERICILPPPWDNCPGETLDMPLMSTNANLCHSIVEPWQTRESQQTPFKRISSNPDWRRR